MNWISVKDTLPPDYRKVVVWVTRFGYFPPYMDIASRQDGRWTDHEGTWKAITHWHKLPEPPKDGE